MRYLPLTIFICTFLVCLAHADTFEIQSIHVTAGAIELAKEPKHGYVFHYKGGDDFFDTSLNAALSNKTAFAPGIPGLKNIGFKLDNGKEYLFSTAPEIRLMQLASQEFPGHKLLAELFESEGGQRLEIRVSGQTPVYRVDLKMDGHLVILWSNITDEENQKKK